MIRAAAFALFVLAVLTFGLVPASAHTLPTSGEQFRYTESVLVNNGVGNYTGYDEGIFTNGSIAVTSLLANGTDNATYSDSWHDEDNQGYTYTQYDSGAFSFSPSTFHYVAGSDNQTAPGQSATGLTVWFYMDNTLANGSTFYLVGYSFTVLSTDQPYPLASSSTGWVKTIYADGTGSYQRNDGYGVFTASYNWRVYFDPASGFIIGYLYSENDTDGAGDGFTWTDTLAVTSTTYALTPTSAPPSSSTSTGTSGSVFGAVLGLVLIVVIVVIVIAVVYALTRRRREPLARHSVQGNMAYTPMYPPPPGLNMNVGQPAVQQIVIKETVKTNCKYCGTLIDTTATVCPKCGAPRT